MNRGSDKQNCQIASISAGRVRSVEKSEIPAKAKYRIPLLATPSLNFLLCPKP